jgi:outer membrane protein
MSLWFEASIALRSKNDAPCLKLKFLSLALRSLIIVLPMMWTASLRGQITFSSAVTLALQNSPRVKVTEDDVHRAMAALAETKAVYIPVLGATGGLGKSYGITLNIPAIFTANAQSLIFSYSQRDYIRGARQSLQAAMLASTDVREQVEEDAAITYIALDQAHRRLTVMNDEYGIAQRLAVITQERVAEGLDTKLDLKKTQKIQVQIRLQQLGLEDEISALEEHLTQLMGVSADHLVTISSSIPDESSFLHLDANVFPDSAGLNATRANAQAKLQQAFGDSRYLLRPQVLFQAQYGRISPINNVSSYYNLNGKYNTFEAGVVIQFPLLDRVHVERARETMVDAMHLRHEAEIVVGQQKEDRLRWKHAIAELATKADLAEIDRGIAQDQLEAVLLEVHTRSGSIVGRQLTPKDEQNARIEEQQKNLDVLDATLQLRKARIYFMRRTQGLEQWVKSAGDLSPAN